MNIYIGNLSHEAGEEDLYELFAGYGAVISIKIAKDNYTGRPKGFAFLEMMEREEGLNAIQALHETEFMERTIMVNEAKPQPAGGGGFRGRPGGGGGGFRGNRDGGGYRDRNRDGGGGGYRDRPRDGGGDFRDRRY